MKKQTRTISGVTPVAVMTRPMPCPGNCVYCPNFAETPRSYTPKSPAVLRARAKEYDPAKQVSLRLKILTEMGHPVDKVELIIMGGTFLASPADYEIDFIKNCYDALNGAVSTSLEEAKTANEKAACRCVGLCIETRPDRCTDDDIARMLSFGTTRVELGVQMLDNDIYKLVRRGHDVQAVIDATRRLKEAGLKVHYHWMPGLPGSSPEADMAMTRELFDNPDFRPDGLKIYPTMVVFGTELEAWRDRGRYQPYDDETMLNLVVDMKKLVPPYVRISRVLRDIPSVYISGGLRDSLRDTVQQIMASQGSACRCIRCREYGHRVKQGKPVGVPFLQRLEYNASEGQEIFLEYIDVNDTLFGLLRLRNQLNPPPELAAEPEKKVAIIRELHIFGAELPLGEHEGNSAQHRGLGRRLIEEAEHIARDEFKASAIAILSGVGAREYYRQEFCYELNGAYMVKKLSF